MRMWMVNPKYMCRKHLLGEHLEIHMFIGTIEKNISVAGYIAKGMLEPGALKSRHDELVAEMLSRGYKHNTPVNLEDNWVEKKIPEYMNVKINPYASLGELIRRCDECRKLYFDETAIKLKGVDNE